MNGISKCSIINIIWMLLSIIAVIVAFSTLRPDATKKALCNSSSAIIDFFNMRKKSTKDKKNQYYKRDRSYENRYETYDEPDAFIER